jgi:hypothetical protein
MNLSSLGSFSSLATSALDTARSTFKGLAEAAVSPGDTDSSTPGAQSPRTERAKPADRPAAPAVKTDGRTDATEAKVPGRRFGSHLDAYA